MKEKRLAQLNQLLQANPDDPFVHYAIGLEHLNGGDISLALPKFKELTENYPDYVPTYYQYAIALVQSNQINEAIGTIRKGVHVASAAGERKTVNELQALLEDLED